MEVSNHTIVTLRFSMWNAAGDLMEDNSGKEPYAYVHGSGNLMPALEVEMIGMRSGESKTFSIHDKILQSTFHFKVFVEDVRIASPTEINSGWPSNREVTTDCGPGCIC